MLRRLILFSTVGIGLLTWVSGVNAVPVTLEIGTYPPNPDIQPYDPSSPPGDLPKDDKNVPLTGDATFDIDADIGNFNVAGTGTTGKFKLSEAKVTVTPEATVIRLPNNETGADSDLRKHEEGHHELYKWHYEQNAKRKLEDAMRGIEDMVFMVTGSTPLERHNNALDAAEAELNKRRDKYVGAMKKQVDAINKKYDKLTDHGRNDKTAADGVAETKKEIGQAPKAGQQQLPNDQEGGAQSENSSGASYDPALDQFFFQGINQITSTNFPGDPLVGRAQFQTGPLLPIGPQENGTQHLAYSTFALTDPVSGETLLDGLLYEVAYMPSFRPGFGGMFQAYLDIPPLDVLGTNNILGSPTLNALQQAVANNQLTMFWYHTQAPAYDAQGNIILPPGGTPGLLEFGIAQAPLQAAIPEPAGLVIAAMLVGMLGVGRRSRAK